MFIIISHNALLVTFPEVVFDLQFVLWLICPTLVLFIVRILVLVMPAIHVTEEPSAGCTTVVLFQQTVVKHPDRFKHIVCILVIYPIMNSTAVCRKQKHLSLNKLHGSCQQSHRCSGTLTSGSRSAALFLRFDCFLNPSSTDKSIWIVLHWKNSLPYVTLIWRSPSNSLFDTTAPLLYRPNLNMFTQLRPWYWFRWMVQAWSEHLRTHFVT